MTAIKVQCECGQKYAFDIEPINRQMPYPVACPSCGTDGTATANEIIAGELPPIPVQTNTPHLNIAASASTTQNSSSPPRQAGALRNMQLGLVNRDQAKHEARAKTMWGDSPTAVINYLMIQGFNHQEASELVQELSVERKAAVRANGMRKIITGSGMICVPIVAFIFFLSIKFMPLKIMGIAIAIGLWGAWILLSGVIMVCAPKMESGDLAGQ